MKFNPVGEPEYCRICYVLFHRYIFLSFFVFTHHAFSSKAIFMHRDVMTFVVDLAMLVLWVALLRYFDVAAAWMRLASPSVG